MMSKSNQDVTASDTPEDSKKLLRAQLSAGFIGMEKRSKDDRSRSSLKLDGRKRSKTTLSDNNQNGHAPVAQHEQLSVQTSLGDGTASRPRSLTGDSNDQFILIDTISIDESVDGNVAPYDMWDEADGGTPDNERASQEIEKLKMKIKKIRQQLVEMQNMKAENVQEFLESANQKNKLNFEKRQQKTNANIQQMQRKLDKYQKMLKEYEERGVSQHRAKEMFRGMHDAVKAGASSISGAVTKPIESMNKFIKKDRRSGSADNLGTSAITGDGSLMQQDETEQSYLNSCSDDDTSSISSTTNLPLNLSGSINAQSLHTHSVGSELEKLQHRNNEVVMLRKENEELRDTVQKLKDQLLDIINTLNYERFRVDDLQGQFRDLFNQYNDLTELHQQEVMEVKEELYKAADRIECVDYRSAERAGEIEEALDSCVTRINKMELQQHQQQQLLLSVDGYFDGSGTAKVLLSKVLSLAVSLFAIVLVLVSLVARIISPFTSTWKRALISFSLLLAILLLWKNADKPLLKELNHKISDFVLVFYERFRRKSTLTKGDSTSTR
ncbi:transmembrane and coiled-coil domains protein 1-like isoform X1 [Rhopilema esculentum]|uniref:transmembrane and coiled-coil domains protein 1-like isoform X1 n=1 Tax=Rhopilema esculentum TaxID=499914 RepID=UPI0031D1F5AA